MRVIWAVMTAAMLTWSPAWADESDNSVVPKNGDAAVGVGVICNTAEEAQEFVKLRSNGAEAQDAIQSVNAGANDERACGVAAIAFVRDETVHTTTLHDKLVQVVRINVVAGFNGSAWQAASGVIQYAVLEGGGESI